MDRRDFFNTSVVFGLSAFISGCSLKTNSITKSVKNKNIEISKENEEQNNLLLIKTINNIGKIEYNFFISFFNLNSKNSQEVVNKIIEIQGKNGLKPDGIIGESTLKKIYKKFYSKKLEKLTEDIKNRWNVYLEMKEYPKKYTYRNGKKIGTKGMPNVFNKYFYYGYLNTINIENTYIDNTLTNIIPHNINEIGNKAFVRKINGKFVTSLYIDGELVLASYCSPGNFGKYGNGAKTLKGKHKSRRGTSNMYYISGAVTSVKKDKNGKYWSDKMPYKVHVVNGISVHAGNVNGSLLSHGCIRLPLLYAKGFYEIFNSLPSNNGDIIWDIQDTY